MFNHYWSFLGCLFSPYFLSCVPPSLVRQLGFFFPRSDAWSLDLDLEPFASSSRRCIQRAVKRLYGKGTGIYSCSITDREEYIGAFRWGYCFALLNLCMAACGCCMLLSGRNLHVPTIVKKNVLHLGNFCDSPCRNSVAATLSRVMLLFLARTIY
ncbi:hypothetical protein CI102_773 [Trichoderma harzianum]|nr:hypothetical protein CI102_773 [Trichoderma harzianum]